MRRLGTYFLVGSIVLGLAFEAQAKFINFAGQPWRVKRSAAARGPTSGPTPPTVSGSTPRANCT